MCRVCACYQLIALLHLHSEAQSAQLETLIFNSSVPAGIPVGIKLTIVHCGMLLSIVLFYLSRCTRPCSFHPHSKPRGPASLLCLPQPR